MYIDEGFGNVEIATDSGESRSQKKKADAHKMDNE